jgi:hypothetical protein
MAKTAAQPQTSDTYAVGAVKQDPDTLAIAVRTALASEDGSMDWGVMTIDHGGYYTSSDEVAGWADL